MMSLTVYSRHNGPTVSQQVSRRWYDDQRCLSIEFTPTLERSHQVTVRWRRSQITGSPFTVAVDRADGDVSSAQRKRVTFCEAATSVIIKARQSRLMGQPLTRLLQYCPPGGGNGNNLFGIAAAVLQRTSKIQRSLGNVAGSPAGGCDASSQKNMRITRRRIVRQVISKGGRDYGLPHGSGSWSDGSPGGGYASSSGSLCTSRASSVAGSGVAESSDAESSTSHVLEEILTEVERQTDVDRLETYNNKPQTLSDRTVEEEEEVENPSKSDGADLPSQVDGVPSTGSGNDNNKFVGLSSRSQPNVCRPIIPSNDVHSTAKPVNEDAVPVETSTGTMIMTQDETGNRKPSPDRGRPDALHEEPLQFDRQQNVAAGESAFASTCPTQRRGSLARQEALQPRCKVPAQSYSQDQYDDMLQTIRSCSSFLSSAVSVDEHRRMSTSPATSPPLTLQNPLKVCADLDDVGTLMVDRWTQVSYDEIKIETGYVRPVKYVLPRRCRVYVTSPHHPEQDVAAVVESFLPVEPENQGEIAGDDNGIEISESAPLSENDTVVVEMGTSRQAEPTKTTDATAVDGQNAGTLDADDDIPVQTDVPGSLNLAEGPSSLQPEYNLSHGIVPDSNDADEPDTSHHRHPARVSVPYDSNSGHSKSNGTVSRNGAGRCLSKDATKRRSRQSSRPETCIVHRPYNTIGVRRSNYDRLQKNRNIYKRRTSLQMWTPMESNFTLGESPTPRQLCTCRGKKAGVDDYEPGSSSSRFGVTHQDSRDLSEAFSQMFVDANRPADADARGPMKVLERREVDSSCERISPFHQYTRCVSDRGKIFGRTILTRTNSEASVCEDVVERGGDHIHSNFLEYLDLLGSDDSSNSKVQPLPFVDIFTSIDPDNHSSLFRDSSIDGVPSECASGSTLDVPNEEWAENLGLAALRNGTANGIEELSSYHTCSCLDHIHCTAYGPGLRCGTVARKNHFQVETKINQ